VRALATAMVCLLAVTCVMAEPAKIVIVHPDVDKHDPFEDPPGHLNLGTDPLTQEAIDGLLDGTFWKVRYRRSTAPYQDASLNLKECGTAVYRICSDFDQTETLGSVARFRGSGCEGVCSPIKFKVRVKEATP